MVAFDQVVESQRFARKPPTLYSRRLKSSE
jgi:hypothetical protein